MAKKGRIRGKAGFSSEIDEYIIQKLSLSDYKETGRELANTYYRIDSEINKKGRRREKYLLKKNFRNWKKPYHGVLLGWKEDSPLYIFFKDRLVGGVYLCNENEFHEGERWGQLHYPFIDPSFKGKGIYSVLIKKLIEKARKWGLQGLIINSDRHMLPDVYMRWGANPWKIMKKQTQRAGIPSAIISRILRAREIIKRLAGRQN